MSLVNTIMMPPFASGYSYYTQISSDGTNVWTALIGVAPVYKIPCNDPLNPITVLNNTGWIISGISSDGTNVWVSYADGDIFYLAQINCITATVTNTLNFGNTYYNNYYIGEVSSDGTNVWVVFINATAVSSFVFKVNCATLTYNPTPITTGYRSIGISSDGTNVWVANGLSYTITQIDCSSGMVVRNIGTQINPTAISSDGTNVWFTNVDAGNFSGYSIIDCSTGNIIHSVTGSQYQAIGGISSNGTYVYIVNNYTQIIILDAITFDGVTSINSGISNSYSISFDGQFAWSTSLNYQVYQISAPVITNFIVDGLGDLGAIFEKNTIPIKPLGLLGPTNLVLPVSTISQSYGWACIANSTGQYIYVWAESLTYNSSKSTLYFSSNFGQTFNPVSLSGQTQGVYNFFLVAVSNSGQYVAISAVNSVSIASIFISSDYGLNFNSVTYPPGQATGTLTVSTATSVSINDSGLFLCSIGYTYSPYNQISNVWYSNNVTTNPSNPNWYLQITSSYGPALLDITASFAVISADSTNPSIPEFMIATNKNGVWIYNSLTSSWINTFLGDFNFSKEALCRINSSGSVAVVCSANNTTSTSEPSNSLFYISNNATTASPTWTQITTFPQVISTNPFSFDINSLGNTIVCLPYNNTVIYGAIEILASYDNGVTWNIIYVSTSIAGLILTSIFCYGTIELTSTGPFFNQPPSGTAPIVIGTFQNLQTKFLINSGQDLGYIFVQQETDPGSNYIVTNFKVQNYTPAWTTVTGIYDLGQIFKYKYPYIATGSYNISSSGSTTTITFTGNGTIIFCTNVGTINGSMTGGGAGGSNGTNFIYQSISTGLGGNGGGGGQILNFSIGSGMYTLGNINYVTVGNGGSANTDGYPSIVQITGTYTANGGSVNGGGAAGLVSGSSGSEGPPQNTYNAAGGGGGGAGGYGGSGGAGGTGGSIGGGLGGTGGGTAIAATPGNPGDPNTGAGGGGGAGGGQYDQFGSSGGTGGSGVVVLSFNV